MAKKPLLDPVGPELVYFVQPHVSPPSVLSLSASVRPVVPAARLLYVHPQATHTARLATAWISYALVRSQRRTIGLEIGAAGLTVRVPVRATMAQVEAVLQSKAGWVLDKLHERQMRHIQTPHIHWAHGGSLPYLGGRLELHLHPAAPRVGELLAVGDGRWVLHLPLELHAAAAQVRAAVTAWWVRHARSLFAGRLHQWAPVLGVQWRGLRLSSARTRWGSAKSDGTIMLNWRLLHFRLPVVDYVVIHELAHLREMNHSPRFWSLVGTACPDYLVLRDELRQRPIPHWGAPGEDGPLPSPAGQP